MSGSMQSYEQVLDEMGGRGIRISGSTLLLTLAGCIFCLLLWAGLAEIDEVTRGQGKVVTSNQVQIIQSYEGGIIRRVAVREGEIVEKGEILMELDQTEFQGKMNQVQQLYNSVLVSVQRLKSEINGTELAFTEDLRESVPDIVASETQLYSSRQEKLESELSVMARQLFQREQELAEAQVVKQTSESSLELLESELQIVKPLVERGLEGKIALLQLERKINDLQAERDRASFMIERLKSAILEMADKSNTVAESFREEALKELSAATARAEELSSSIPTAADKLDRTDVRSPVRGVVNRVHITTVGGVAPPGEPLVEVVPLGDTLLVEAYIKPDQIAFLYPGQDVKVKISAYDFSRYGALSGTLETIGADAVRLPETDLTMYPVRVNTTSILTDKDGQPLDIIPGMVAEVEILSEKKSVLDYILRPVLRIQERAFRD